MLALSPGVSRFFASRTLPMTAPSIRRMQWTLGILAVLFLFLFHRSSSFVLPKPYLLPPDLYVATLHEAISEYFPGHVRQALREALDSSSATETEFKNIPNRVYQTDKIFDTQDTLSVRKWHEMGFEREFLDDVRAEQFVERYFNGSEVWRTFQSLPLSILKADMLRYLFLLAEGGVYADMDVLPLKPLSEWTQVGHSASGHGRDEPLVRMIVGIEGDLHIWRNFAETKEGLYLSGSERYRSLQITQWTLASHAHHPILVDVVRRIVQTAKLAEARTIEVLREALALEAAGRIREARRERQRAKPWEAFDDRGRLAVQEWTGPAVWTDAVMSYLLATDGVRERDLYGLKHPLQVGDVLVLPIDGFNPRDHRIKDISCVEHLFRGSWKQPS